METSCLLALIVLLLLVVIFDVNSNRIPNYLVLAIIAMGILSQVLKQGLSGLTVSFSGIILGLVCFLPFYLKKGMGAGDVKLMAAIGSFFGAKLTLLAIAYTLIFGGVFALFIVLAKGNIRLMSTRFFDMAKVSLAMGKLIYFPAGENEPSEIRFPYATAITAGTFLILYQHYTVNIDFL